MSNSTSPPRGFEHPKSLVRDLTVYPTKAAALGDLPAVGDGLTTIDETTGGAMAWLWRHGLILIKPDLAARPEAVGALLGKLHSNGFDPVGFSSTQMHRPQVFELRRFNALFTTLLGAEAGVISQTVGPTMPIVLRDRRPVVGVPAAVRLNALKPTLRDQLTSFPESMGGIHISDEPIDVAHELSAVLGDGLSHILRQSHSGRTRTSEIRQALNQLEQTNPVELLSGDEAFRRIQQQTRSHESRHGTSALTQEADVFCGRALGGESLDFRRLFWLLDEAGIEVEPWTAFAATATLFDRFYWPKATAPWVDGATAEQWQAKRAGLDDPHLDARKRDVLDAGDDWSLLA